MAIVWSNVTDIAPELAGAAVSAATQTAVLADVNDQIVAAQFPSVARADIARAYLAAHLATLSIRNGVGGSVSPS